MAELTMADIEQTLKRFNEAWENKPPLPACIYMSKRTADAVVGKAKELGVCHRCSDGRDYLFGSLLIARYDIENNTVYFGEVKD